MTRIHMGSDSTLIAVASIPPHIWQQDKEIWKAWTTSRNATLATRQKYKKVIADFYYTIEKAILQVTEQDLSDYAEASLCAELSPVTIKQHMNIIRAYWKFARMQHYPIFAHVVDLWEISQYGPNEFYAYEINAPECVIPLKHIKDEQGHDAVYSTFDEAKAAIMTQIAQPTNA